MKNKSINIVLILLSLIIVLSLSGCDKGNTNPNSDPTYNSEEPINAEQFLVFEEKTINNVEGYEVSDYDNPTAETFVSDSITIPSTYNNKPVFGIRDKTIIDGDIFCALCLMPQTHVVLEEGIKYIGSYAFYNAFLTTIELPDSLESIGVNAFCESNLTTITIPKNVVEFDASVFVKESDKGLSAIKKLESVNVDDNNKYMKSIDGVLYSKDGKKLIYYPYKKTNENVILATNLEEIGQYAIVGNYNIKSIVLPEGLTTLGKCCINTVNHMNSINIPSSVELKNAEGNCKNYQFAFSGNARLTQITIDSQSVAELDYNSKYNYYSTGYDLGIYDQLYTENLDGEVNGKTIYVKSNLTVGSYISTKFTKSSTSDKAGYDKYFQNAKSAS